MIGETLKGRYYVQTKIGEGAMGKVYRALDQQSGDLVAVKVMSKELAKDEDYRKRFSREAAALQKIQHPSIVGYIDAFSLEGEGYLVTEFFGGGDLRQQIKQGAMPEGKFKDIALKIIDAVAAAHEAGIIHRDLKPENILMSATSQPKVADFGLARDQNLSTMTASGSIMGTLAYMPPEAFDAFIRQDHRGDIWALGVIMFEMLTTGLPFRARSQSEMIAAILSDNPINLLNLRRDIPAPWATIIELCLEKDINQRYQSARDLLADLRNDRVGVVASQNFMTNIHTQFAANQPLPSPEGFSESPQGISGLRFLDTAQPEKALKPLSVKKPNTGYLKPLPQDYAVPPVRAEHRAHKKDLTGQLIDLTPTKANANTMLLAGLFVWSGVLLTIFTALMLFMYIMRGEDAVGITLDNLSMLQALGTLLFSLGLLFEVFQEEGWRRWTLVSMTIFAALFWLLFFSQLIFPDTGHVMGMTAYIFLMLFYFQIKR